MNKSKKIDVKDFIIKFLKNNNCKNVHISGENIHCQCPFHNPIKNTRSFGISFSKEEKGFPYQCFSCGERGNIFTLIAHINRCSYKKAERFFLKRVVISQISLTKIKNNCEELHRRNSLKKEVSVKFPEKFSPKKMVRYLENRNEVSQHKIMNIPYIISKYDLYYCDGGRYAKRIIMPIRDINGERIFFTNRAINEKMSKNLFIPGANASAFLYGLFEVLPEKRIILVEGPFEVFQLKSYMIRERINGLGVVALMGTILSEERLEKIIEFFDEIFILFDHDKAGLQGEKKAFIQLSDCVKTHRLTEYLYKGKDPANSSKRDLKRIFDRISSLCR